MALPSTYQEVEYIEANGTQYIMTSLKPDYNTKISARFSHTSTTADTPLFWARNWYNNRQWILWSHPLEYNSGEQWVVQFWNNENTGTWRQSISDYALWTIIDFEYDNNWWKYGSQTWTWTPPNNSTSYNLVILWLNHWGSVDSRKFYGKLYYFKYWSSWTLMLDLVPCYRKSDSVIWLYDIVNNQFYTNSWTGTFTKWPDVAKKNIYLWSTKLSKIYVWSSEVKEVYVWNTMVWGGNSWWTPWSNTLIYYPLTSNLVDQMWNWNTGTAHWNVTFSSSTWVYVDWDNGIYVSWLSNWIANKSWPRTLNVWAKYEALKNNAELLWNSGNTISNQSMKIEIYSARTCLAIQIANGTNISWTWTGYITPDTNWHNYSITFSWSEYKRYIDWVLIATATTSTPPNNYPDMYIGDLQYYSARRCKWYVKDYIVENKVRTASEISDYYNLTKSTYWL